MAKNSMKGTLAEVLTADTQAELIPAVEEQPKRKTRKSDIIREPMAGASGETLKKKRTRRGKPAELRKSHSCTVLMTEQMYQKFKTITENEGVSMNGVITRLLRKYIIAHDIDDNMLDI